MNCFRFTAEPLKKRLVAIMLLLGVWNLSAGPAYPLKLVPGQHYVADQNGAPFFIQGDSPWFLIESLNSSDVDYYLSNRWVQGYNSIILNLTAQANDDFQSYEGNIYGQLPFTNTIAGSYTNLLSWNEAYFTNVDWVIQRAGHYGLCVFAYPLYDSIDGASWYAQMAGNSSNSVWQYGNFIGNRYKNFTNLVWIGVGDFSEPDAPDNCLWNIVAAGILSADTNHLISAQAGRPVPASYYSEFITLNSSYGSEFPYVESLANYQFSPVMPSFAREPYYENHDLNGTTLTSRNSRQFAYWAIFSGDMGHFYGDEAQWIFVDGWQDEMWDAGATTITNVIKLMNTRPWYNCIPDSGHVVVVNGYGMWGGNDYVAATAEATGKTLLAYIPQGQSTLTVDTTKISGPTANAWWYDPQTGDATAIHAFNTTGFIALTPPDSNDWVLVLDDATAGFPPPGSAIPALLQIIDISPPDGFAGEPYSAQLPAAGGAGPYTWDLVSGDLPSGLTLGANGLLAGMPATAGTFDFTAQVSDSKASTAFQSFELTIYGSNTPPTISAINDQFISAWMTTGPLQFAIGDAETQAAYLMLTASSSNPALVPASNIVFGGAGSSRTVTVSPVGGGGGTATITITVNDGQLNSSTSFVLTVSPSAQPNGLVAAYSFDEGSGTTIIDSSGNGNNGALNDVIWTTAGKFSNALLFDGASRVTVPNSSSLELTNGMTLEAWVYPTIPFSEWATVVMKEQSQELAYTLYAGSPANQPSGWIYTDQEEGFPGPLSLPLNAWSHLATTYDGGVMRLYVNAVQVGSLAVSGTIVTSSQDLSIGGNGVWGEYFEGVIDELRIYNRALSMGEIQTDMNSPIGGSPRLNIQALGGGAIRIWFVGAPNLTYRIQSATNISTGVWGTTGSVTTDSSGMASFQVTATSVPRFYRTACP